MSVPQFHEQVRQQTDAIWQAIYTHPFVQEVGQGTLARAAFEFFIRQDYLYLKEFARVLCLGGAKADNLETLAMFTEHAATVVQVEHLLAVAHSGTLGETVAAVLPCYWIYWEVGKRLNQAIPNDPIYATWIQAYANPAFGTHVEQQLTLIDRLATQASEPERQHMTEHFAYSCRYEFLFWDQAYHRTTWTV
jgi:thiaminase/transcriptional activator TenA